MILAFQLFALLFLITCVLVLGWDDVFRSAWRMYVVSYRDSREERRL